MSAHGLQNSRGRVSNLMRQMKNGCLLPKRDQRGKHNNRPNKYSDHIVLSAKQHIDSFKKKDISLKKMYKNYYLPWCEENRLKPVNQDKYRQIYLGKIKFN